MYLYICGSVGGRRSPYVPRASRREIEGAIWAAPGPSLKSCVQLIGPLACILESEYEHMCDLCVRRVTELPAQFSLDHLHPVDALSYPLLSGG